MTIVRNYVVNASKYWPFQLADESLIIEGKDTRFVEYNE